MSGIKTGAQRPKTSKHLRSRTEKRFRNDSAEAKTEYATKMSARILRRQKQSKRRH